MGNKQIHRPVNVVPVPSHTDNAVLDNAIRISTYAELHESVTAFADGFTKFLVIIGPGSTGKSQAIRRAVGGCDSVLWIGSHAKPFGLYKAVYHASGDSRSTPLTDDKNIVINDCDPLLSDKITVAMMKQLTETDDSTVMTWTTNNADIRNGVVPDRFQTSSNVCLITNQWPQKNENLKALESRAEFLLFTPSNDEIHSYVGEWFKDREIYDYVGQHLSPALNLGCRQYVIAAGRKKSGRDWKWALTQMWQADPKRHAIYHLYDEGGEFYGKLSPVQQVTKWKELMGGKGSKATLYRWKKTFGY